MVVTITDNFLLELESASLWCGIPPRFRSNPGGQTWVGHDLPSASRGTHVHKIIKLWSKVFVQNSLEAFRLAVTIPFITSKSHVYVQYNVQ